MKNYYKTKVKEVIEVEGKRGAITLKHINFTYLVEANSVSEAEARVTKYIGPGDYEVTSVREEKLEAVVLKEEK